MHDLVSPKLGPSMDATFGAPGLTRNKKPLVTKGIATRSKEATRNKCIASSNKGLTSSNKKLVCL